MKNSLRLVLFIASLCASATSTANVTYTFTGFFGNYQSPQEVDFTGAFTFTVANYLTSDMDISPSKMLNCHAGDLACTNVHFFQDAQAADLTSDFGVQAIGLSDADGLTGYYYFSASTFSTPGTYSAIYGYGVAPSTLSVSSVPEPGNGLSWLAGLTLLGAVAYRSRKF